MELFDSSSELSRIEEDDEVKNIISNIGRSKILGPKPGNSNLLAGGVQVDGKNMEQQQGMLEKRARREIANSNERRRMQSINSGFSSLRTLLPHHEGEKLSKAAILQQTAEYIYSLEQEKTRLLSQNCQLKRLLGQTQYQVDNDETDSGPAPKRRLIDTGQKMILEDEVSDELAEYQSKWERERSARLALEERLRLLESEMYRTDGGGGGGVKVVRQQESRQTVQEPMEQIQETVTGGLQVLSGGGSVLTPGAKKQAGGMETLILESAPGQGVPQQLSKLPSIIQVKGEAGRVEVEQIPRITELAGHEGQAVEIASVQDPETGATRQYIVTQMSDSTSKQNLETIVEAIRHLEGDHLFSEESGPHQVVKEEVVESCIIEDNGVVSNVMEVVTLPNNQQFNASNIISSLPQVPVASLQHSGGGVGVGVGGGGGHSLVPVSVSNLVSSLQQPLPQNSFLPQVPVTGPSVLPPVSTVLHPSLPLELSSSGGVGVGGQGVQVGSLQTSVLGHGPPQTSPVNLELGLGSGDCGVGVGVGLGGPESPSQHSVHTEMSNSPPQSSPVNLAQQPQQMEH